MVLSTMVSKGKFEKLIATTSITDEELNAILEAFNVKNTSKFTKSTWFLIALVSIHGLVIGFLAIANPYWFIDNLISPSVLDTQFLIFNTRIRGSFMLCVILLVITNLNNTKRCIFFVNTALFWVVAMAVLDFIKLFYLEIFTASFSTQLFLIWRPILVGILFLLRNILKNS